MSQNAQQARIDQLERSAAESVSLSSFHALTSRVEATIDHLNTQFGSIDRRLSELDDQLAAMADTLTALPDLRASIDTKLDTETWTRRTEESRAFFSEQLAHVRNDKAAKAVVSSLETSQHRLVEEVLAVQKVLACKIDRVEVPLLDVASEKLQYLLDFQQAADARLDKSEADMAQLQRAIQTKEGRDSAAKAVAALREELSRKVDGAFVKEQVLAPLHHAEDEIVRLKASEDALDKLLTDYHTHIEKLMRVEKVVADTRSEAGKQAAAQHALAEQLVRKVDQHTIDELVLSNSDEVEQLVRSYESKAAHEAKVQAAYLSDVRLQLEDLQRYQTAVDAKLQMALRFIDWFTDVKMKHQ